MSAASIISEVLSYPLLHSIGSSAVLQGAKLLFFAILILA
jgi:hypothetical protein